HLYDLDRLDLTVSTTLDVPAQAEVVGRLRSLADRDTVRKLGWDTPRLLGGGNPSEVVYTVLLYELDGERGSVRVQADNFRGPFDLNESARLELGSTAKLRTLLTYLEIVERLHGELGGVARDSLRAIERSETDPITRWTAGQLAQQPELPLSDLLEAAMERRYSASPAETFFTGGGSHRFRNFDRTFDGRVISVREGFTHSVNLLFVRLMRDVERFYRQRVPGSTARVLEDADSPARTEYLERFADREGRIFVRRFYREYRGLDPDTVLEKLVRGRRPIPLRMARAFRFVDSTAGTEPLAAFLESQLPGEGVNPSRVRELWEEADPTVHDLPDLGYLTRIHPLELWVARHLYQRPEATLEEVVAASADARQEVYRWLFRSRRRAAQDQRIRILLEIEAFLEIQDQWQKLGYPFPNVVPSYGSSIGSSGDRPSALADLVGILLSDGLRPPPQRVTRVRIAPDTPYETVLEREPAEPQRVLSSEVAAVARRALVDVVERGTARTAAGAVPGPDGEPFTVGGKTGTGDNQVRIFGPGGRLVESRPLNRTATFVFFAGDELYGVVTAHVPGAAASGFGFTSALPVHVFRWLGPVIAEAGSAGPGPAPGG
ncbi:MAG TPA: glycosyl transferase family 51, partial [Thermoanaerobaculia bacterium]|nr:glycosyl transferase family 51 [Thermoanaerobaculia bacterium]